MSDEGAVSVENPVWIHSVVIASYGGASGIRDAGSLEAAAARPYTSFGGQETFAGPFAEAVALMESIIQRYLFVDGHKRTGAASAVYLLRRDGHGVTNPQLVELSLAVAEHRMSASELGSWFAEHTETL